MSTPADEGDNPYSAPQAELREELPPREWQHVFMGMASGLVGMVLFWQQFKWTGTVQTMLSVMAILSAGLVLSRFRQMRLVAALVLGFPLVLLCMVGFLFITNFLGIV